ncbi:DUF2380 domain-containing protein [Methylorubrum zatmanii]|uniref:DUF2380 domain-containing protein n=1 Tax=Methylorubrum zatmanii TaxID=29429 RepID=A0ABW1WQH0_9HYPH
MPSAGKQWLRRGIRQTARRPAAIAGEVQKVSNLILSIDGPVKPLAAGVPEQAYSVDRRGNTDGSSDRAIHYLVKTRLLGGR